MPAPDLNLLVALDALLAEGSVTAAARRLGLSPSAMSRTLARLRAATGDPLLVQAGRALAPTPYAQALRERVHRLSREAQAVLAPGAAPSAAAIDPARLERDFTIRANEGFMAVFAPVLVAAVRAAAPQVRLRFAPKPQKDPRPLRDGQVDLDIGVAGESAPEVRSRVLLRDRFVGAARAGHPLFAEPLSPARYAACHHVVASRRGAAAGPVDAALQALGLARQVVVTVPGFPDALAIARRSDLVALVPHACFAFAGPGDDASDSADSGALTQGLIPFDLPVDTPALEIAALWHPRLDHDPAHRWLRALVITTCRGV